MPGHPDTPRGARPELARSAELAIQAEAMASLATRAILRAVKLVAESATIRAHAAMIRRRACGPCRRAAGGPRPRP